MSAPHGVFRKINIPHVIFLSKYLDFEKFVVYLPQKASYYRPLPHIGKDKVKLKSNEKKMEEIKDKFQDIKDSVQEKAADAKESLQEKAAEVKEAVQEKAADAKEVLKDKAAEAMEDVKETAKGVAQEAEDIKAELKGEKKEPAASTNPQAPAFKLPTGRGLLKMVLLGIITFGIYPLVILTKMSGEINTVASKHDGKSTMNYCLLAFIVGPITLQIGQLVWWHRICNRLGTELKRRNIDFEMSAKTFWMWSFLGSFIVIGPWVFVHKFCKAFNLMNANYNEKG